MPLRSKKPLYKRKRVTTYRRRRRMYRSARPNYSVARTPAVSDRQFVKMKYSTYLNATYVGLSTPQVIQFNTGNVNDTEIALGGHQPKSLDQWAAFYNRYLVYGCSYRITFANRSPSEQAQVFVFSRPNTTTPTLLEDIIEMPYIKTSICGVEGGGALRTIKGYVNNPKILGITKEKFRTDDRYSALIGNNPAHIGPILTAGFTAMDVAQSCNVQVRCDLTFYVCMFDRKNLPQS